MPPGIHCGKRQRFHRMRQRTETATGSEADGKNPMEKNTKTFALEDDPKIPEMPKSEDEQRRQNEDYARNLGLDVIDPIGD